VKFLSSFRPSLILLALCCLFSPLLSQLQWIDQTLSACQTEWLFVVGSVSEAFRVVVVVVIVIIFFFCLRFLFCFSHASIYAGAANVIDPAAAILQADLVPMLTRYQVCCFLFLFPSFARSLFSILLAVLFVKVDAYFSGSTHNLQHAQYPPPPAGSVTTDSANFRQQVEFFTSGGGGGVPLDPFFWNRNVLFATVKAGYFIHRLVALQLVTEMLDEFGNSLYTYTQNQKRSLDYTIYRESSAETAFVVISWLVVCVLPVLFIIWYFTSRSRRQQQEELKKPLVSSGHLHEEEDSSSDLPNSASVVANNSASSSSSASKSPREFEMKEQKSSSSSSSSASTSASSSSSSSGYDMTRLDIKISSPDEKI
jgi:hypothetical protein